MDCAECSRLRVTYDRIVRRNMDTLVEYQAAVFVNDEARITSLRSELHEVEASRRAARLKLDTHLARHEAAMDAA
jgi:hypothetical protein